MRAITCPWVTLDPSSTRTSARRPAYFDETSTCVASMRPLDLTMPAGSVSPRSRAIRFLRKPWAWAEPIGENAPPGPSPSAERQGDGAHQGGDGRGAPNRCHDGSPAQNSRERSPGGAEAPSAASIRPASEALLGKRPSIVKHAESDSALGSRKRRPRADVGARGEVGARSNRRTLHRSLRATSAGSRRTPGPKWRSHVRTRQISRDGNAPRREHGRDPRAEAGRPRRRFSRRWSTQAQTRSIIAFLR